MSNLPRKPSSWRTGELRCTSVEALNPYHNNIVQILDSAMNDLQYLLGHGVLSEEMRSWFAACCKASASYNTTERETRRNRGPTHHRRAKGLPVNDKSLCVVVFMPRILCDRYPSVVYSLSLQWRLFSRVKTNALPDYVKRQHATTNAVHCLRSL